eukprot:3234543-Rhodomonas_salina.3
MKDRGIRMGMSLVKRRVRHRSNQTSDGRVEEGEREEQGGRQGGGRKARGQGRKRRHGRKR